MPTEYLPTMVEPEIIRKTFGDVEKECYLVAISGEEYEVCEESSKDYWANSKPGAYGSGLGKTKDDPQKPVRTGLLGQMAFGKLFGEPVDIAYRQFGDKQDNIIGSYKYDMKYAMCNYGTGLIYHTSEKGKLIPLDKDIYVFGFISSDDRQNKIAKVVTVGFALREDVSACPVMLGRRGNKLSQRHKNYEVPYGTLRPIANLLSLKKKVYG